MRKVLVVAPYAYLPYHSGGQKSIAQFLDHLGEQTELYVISTQKNDASLVRTYKLLPWLVNSTFRYLDFRLYFRISKLLKEEKFDCIMWEHPYFFWLAKWIKITQGIRTIIHTHNIEYQRMRSNGSWWWPLLKWYEGACLKQADHVFFISPEDLQIAVEKWHLNKSKCQVMTFGIPQSHHPTDKKECQQTIRKLHNIPEPAKLLLFNGLLSYKPNEMAVYDLLVNINNRLSQEPNFEYRLIICGKGLADRYLRLSPEQAPNVIFAGFVDNIEMYFKGADVFLNPILSGGGIKTKMVESIGFGTTVVSTETGAVGLVREACGDKIRVVADRDWENFTNAVVKEAGKESITPDTYYQEYHWKNVVAKVPRLLK